VHRGVAEGVFPHQRHPGELALLQHGADDANLPVQGRQVHRAHPAAGFFHGVGKEVQEHVHAVLVPAFDGKMQREPVVRVRGVDFGVAGFDQGAAGVPVAHAGGGVEGGASLVRGLCHLRAVAVCRG